MPADPTNQDEYEQSWIVRDHHRLGIQRYPHPDHQVDPDAAGPLVVLVPGMGVPAGYYRPFIRLLRRQRFRVATLDLRGTGASTPTPTRTTRYGYAELAGDLGAVLDHLVPESRPEPVVLLGHSLGGQLCLLHLATTEDERVAGTALITTGFAYWRAYRGWKRYGVLPFTQLVGATAGVLGVWPGWGFGGRQASGVIRDWAYTGRTGHLPPVEGADVTGALRELRTPVLAASVDHDQFTPPETIDAVCRLLRSAPVEREHFPASVTGRVDHFRWARTPGPIADRVGAFVTSVTGG